ncbi:dicarboxylate/amino acid:cation symporter [Parapedobacter sp. ISTM3]|uniref:dicarboxylate/amino acid:cation symporter n=1 Tax=Parapedobacter sp. ISTM3 TaxID=2800130 RepID=UPI001907670E|nr:dicarboxylate/amino acid:cation symporter [Parapedobacter sp. ISTM3]MBK1438655.1 dicarboxylate/amino acid:cation symporter [Parapedobacter sp. ISTM3]
MERQTSNFLRSYGSILLLLLGIVVGSFVGGFFPGTVVWIKPLGDVFLNLLFAAVIPLLFFAIASAVANIDGSQKLGRIISTMAGVFLGTILIAAVCTIIALWFFPVEAPQAVQEPASTLLEDDPNDTWGDRLVRFVTVDEFYKLLSRENMLAFVIFSFLLGVAAQRSGEAGAPFRRFLLSANEVMKHLLMLIMKVAPLGLGAYFAYQVGTIGPALFGFYAKPLGLYYLLGAFYFAVFFSFYAYVAAGKTGVRRFWKNNILPSATAISTCSSIATMPVNLAAAPGMGIPPAVANVVIPLGTTLHKNGSSMSSIIKIYVAFVLIGWDFFEPMTLLTALGITVLVSIVAGGIPNGGYIGEMLMISVYGLPTEAIPAVMIIGTLVDPMATVLNATGDTVAAMLVSRFALGKHAVHSNEGGEADGME